jgi:formate hydrogenlyase subunit 4
VSAPALVALLGALAGLLAGPLLPGAVQRIKAHMQGRTGASMFQPYRELRRLWRKTVVAPAGCTVVYAAAPALAAAALVGAVLITPVTSAAPVMVLGHDALVLVGLLALARGVLALSAWDTGSGFGLMSASRDLTFAVAGEGLLALVLAAAAVPAGSTDLRAMWAAAAGWSPWAAPVHWCGLVGIVWIVLLETGRQPVDNPDTHLELTMIHEGTSLEYAGRDLAYLTWASAARHWVVLIAAAGLFLPHPAAPGAGIAVIAGEVVVLVAVLAVIETAQAKMRLLRVPRATAAIGLIVLAGIVTWVAGVAL